MTNGRHLDRRREAQWPGDTKLLFPPTADSDQSEHTAAQS